MSYRKTSILNTFIIFLETINPHTSESKVWQKINALFGKTKSTSQSKDALTTALRLLKQYSLTSAYSNLPHDVRLRLEERKFDREMKIEIACAETHDANRFIDYIMQMEIDLALSHGKSTAPREDGITYEVIRHLNSNICNGINPIHFLFTTIYREGVLPWQWKHSLIIPVPKGETGKSRPISLTSCLCKLFERVSLHGKLSNNLYGFIRGKSTKTCFIEHMACGRTTGITVFLGIQAAFDTANPSVILEHLVDLGIKGQLLEIIRNYLSERCAKVYYKGYLTPNAKKFELGTPQGGVLSPSLFNILIDKLMKVITLPSPNCKIICYAEDATEMQIILDKISDKVNELGLVISVPKTKYYVSSAEDIQLMLNDKSVDRCNEFKYLGVPTPLPNNYVKVLCDRLSRRLRPLKTLANRIAGVNLKLCRTFYIAYVRSLVHYNSLQLATLSHSSLRPLETIQNRAMRIILDCPSSTRIVLMQKELNLPPIIDFIQQAATIAGVKVATTGNVNHVYEDGSCILKNMLTGDLAYDKTLHPKIFSIIVSNVRRQNVKLSVEDEVTTPTNPVEVISAKVNIPILPYDSQSNASIMKACWSDSLHTVLTCDFKNMSPLLIYTDGSRNSPNGQAGCGMVAYDNFGRNKIHEKNMVQPRWSTVYESEFGICFASSSSQ